MMQGAISLYLSKHYLPDLENSTLLKGLYSNSLNELYYEIKNVVFDTNVHDRGLVTVLAIDWVNVKI